MSIIYGQSNERVSNELQYPYNLPESNRGSAFDGFGYGDFSDGSYPDVKTNGEHLIEGNPHVNYKLQGITIKDGQNNIKERYQFGYNNDEISLPNERLFLESFSKITPLVQIDEELPSNPITHHFKYDRKQALPGYNSLMVDEWGYCNGLLYPVTSLNVDLSVLQAKYLPDSSYAKMGSLTEISYPTGGKTTFEYELNQYSKYLKKTPDAVTLVNKSGYGGGLRIKKISHFSRPGY